MAVLEIRVKTPYGGGIFEYTAKKPESMLKNHSSTVIIFSYFELCLMKGFVLYLMFLSPNPE